MTTMEPVGRSRCCTSARPSGSWPAPSIMSNLMFSMVAMVQTKFVGDLGAPAVAAVGAGQRVFFALQALLMAIGVGTTALVARSWGAGEQEEASRITSSSLMLGGWWDWYS